MCVARVCAQERVLGALFAVGAAAPAATLAAAGALPGGDAMEWLSQLVSHVELLESLRHRA